MKVALYTLGAILLVVGIFAYTGIGTYNELVSQEEAVSQSWADVETQYQRRADLIPNLVNTVRGAADFESETLVAVTEARARATSINLSADDLSNPSRVQEFMAAQASLGGALGRLLVVSENYPQLRATEAFQTLQTQLEGTENRITVARRDYNNFVATYNTKVRQFPGSIIAGVTGFDRRIPFEAQGGAEKAPQVDFN
ncbi:MAG: LemA family protein [Rhodothermia bacterium]|nr:MAG: LemA family protein [Rhodothermia bacterium]